MPDHAPRPTEVQNVPRMWAACAPGSDDEVFDVWLEGDRHSRIGGDRTLVLKEVAPLIARSVAAEWNSTLDDLHRLAEAAAYIERTTDA